MSKHIATGIRPESPVTRIKHQIELVDERTHPMLRFTFPTALYAFLNQALELALAGYHGITIEFTSISITVPQGYVSLVAPGDWYIGEADWLWQAQLEDGSVIETNESFHKAWDALKREVTLA